VIPPLTNANDRLVLVEIAGQSTPLRFGLNRGDRFAASEQEVIGFAALQQGCPNRDARSSGEIDQGPVLNKPSGLLEERLN
jgi:hypothetical protein